MFTSAIPPPGRPVTCPGCWPRWESASWGRCSSSASSTASGWSTAKGGTASSTRGGRSDSQRSVTVHESSPRMCLLRLLPGSGVNLPFPAALPATSRAGDEPSGPGHAAGRQLRGRVLKRRDGLMDDRPRRPGKNMTQRLGHNLHRGQLRPFLPKASSWKNQTRALSPPSINSTMVFTGPAWCTAVEKNNSDICCWEDVKIK